MKTLVLSFFILLTYIAQPQTDTINTQNHRLQLKHLNLGHSRYLVYFQDKPDGSKYNIEIWDRNLDKNADGTFSMHWLRQNSKDVYSYDIQVDESFKPLKEQITKTSIQNKEDKTEHKHFIFKDNRMYSHQDSLEHNTDSFQMNNTGLAFNWELDLEILGMLPLDQYDTFAVNFYHPGSKSPAKYYLYKKVRMDKLNFNAKTMECWVLKINHNEKQWSEFWIDKATRKVLQMRDYFYGKFRYKQLVFTIY